MRRIGPVGKLLAIFLAGTVVGLVVAFCWTTWRPRSPLTTDLPPEWKEASALFDKRLRARYPPGTPIWKFTNELEAQGFKPTWFEPGGEYGAKRGEGSVMCNVVARVFWQIGKNDTVSAIRGVYREEGCL